MQESVIYRSIQEEAKQEEKRTIATNLLRENVEIGLIVSVTGLSVEEIEQLRKELDESSQH